jgi:hypothetical protein
MPLLRRSAFALIIMLGLAPQAAPAQESEILAARCSRMPRWATPVCS